MHENVALLCSYFKICINDCQLVLLFILLGFFFYREGRMVLDDIGKLTGVHEFNFFFESM